MKETAGHGGVERDRLVGAGVDETEVGGVKGKSARGFVGVPVPGITTNDVAVGFELDADLVLTTGEEFAGEMGDFPLRIGGDGFVTEDRELSETNVLCDVDFPGLIFKKEIFEFGFGLFGDSMDDDVITASDGVFEKLFLEGAEGIPCTCENKKPGGFAIETVDQMDLMLTVLFGVIVLEEFKDERAFFDGIGGGEETGWFIDDKYVGIVVDNAEAVTQGGGLGGTRADVGDFDLVRVSHGLFKSASNLTVDADTFIGQHFAQGGLLGLWEETDEFVHDRFLRFHPPIIRCESRFVRTD